jgi:hypothetical protein
MTPLDQRLTEEYEALFNQPNADQVLLAAQWLLDVAKNQRMEIFYVQQNLGWPIKVVRTAAQMVNAVHVLD